MKRFFSLIAIFAIFVIAGCSSELTTPEEPVNSGELTVFANVEDFTATITSSSEAGIDTVATITGDGASVELPFGSYRVFGIPDDEDFLNSEAVVSIDSPVAHALLVFEQIITPPLPPSNWVAIEPDSCFVGDTVMVSCGSENAFEGHLTHVDVYTTGGDFSFTPDHPGTYYFSYRSDGPVNPPAASVDSLVVIDRPVVVSEPAFAIWCSHQLVHGYAEVTRGDFTQIGWTTINDLPGDYVTFNVFDEPFAPNGSRDLRISESLTIIGRLHHNGQIAKTDTLIIEDVDVPIDPPSTIEIEVDFMGWVGCRPTDAHELVIVPELILPDKTTRIDVRAHLRYSGDDQVNESSAFGLVNGFTEVWADHDNDGCPPFPDQEGFCGDAWFDVGTIQGNQQGSLVMRHAVMFDCYPPNGGDFEGANSLWCKGLRLTIHLD